jgi:hypothetical protein
LARWLIANLDRVQKTPEAAELVDEVTDCIHQARRAIDQPNDDRIYLGPCGARIANTSGYARPPVVCGEELYGVPWLDRAQCLACGAEYRIADRREWMKDRAAQHLGTAPEVAGFLRITGVQCTADMVRGYASRGRLKPVWADDRRRALYLIGDVLDAIRTRYSRQPVS